MPAKPHKGTRMKPNSIALLTLGVSLLALSANGQDRLTREEYIQKYKSLAVEEMEVYGIPASITMAQALLESDNGNGRLAREGNNHFGIKCKSTWTGATISHDDDAKGECFRKYPSVEASFNDHSEFLDKSARYQDLFKLDPMDYKGWAYGLKQAGYATNPAYAELLIKIIEDNQLYHLDRGEEIAPPIMGTPVTEEPQQLVADTEQKPKEVVDVDNYSVAVTGQGDSTPSTTTTAANLPPRVRAIPMQPSLRNSGSRSRNCSNTTTKPPYLLCVPARWSTCARRASAVKTAS